jgi:diguanylate cyclase (GGDEF)-like protein
MGLTKWTIAAFPRKLDQGAFVFYFLGSVVPLAVLGMVVERYALSPAALPADSLSSAGLLGLVGAICLLSLGSFLMLRRLVLREIEKSLATAYYDDLTSLPNRQLFKDRLTQALAHAQRHDQLAAACFLDLDGFKRINDTLGHSVGDQLLCEVADRLRENLRATDSVGRSKPEEGKSSISRLGGDEFTFLLSELAGPDSASAVVWRILEALRKPFVLDGQEVTVTASVGIAVFPSDGEDATTLIRNADAAMYWAKSCGRNNYQFFAKSMDTTSQRKLNIERCLRRSLEQYPFSLHYQPIRSAETSEVVAVEALLRWNDAELGAVGPAEFIPVAEEAGLIAPLGEWVLRTACMQVQAWRDAGYRPLRMCVNVSGIQIRHPAWVARVAGILADTGLTSAALELEITESTILHDDDATLEALKKLSEMGISLALDDFGTGYSSLSYLQSFPIDRVKIDQGFTRSLSTDLGKSLTSGIISMARNMRIAVVAEGVETREQADFLREQKCDELQGYLFSPAVPAEEFERFLEAEKPE